MNFTATTWGTTAAMFFATIGALVFPASAAALDLERYIVLAICPVALGQMIRGLGQVYLLVLVVIGAYLVGIGMLVRWMPYLPLELGLAPTTADYVNTPLIGTSAAIRIA